LYDQLVMMRAILNNNKIHALSIHTLVVLALCMSLALFVCERAVPIVTYLLAHARNKPREPVSNPLLSAVSAVISSGPCTAVQLNRVNNTEQ